MAFYDTKIREEELKHRVAADWFAAYDCAGGTGNLEAGLTNKYNVFVSTLDQQDVDVIHQTLGDSGAKTLLDALKSAMKVLARQIEPKVYEYGFLRK